jgi:hypothetical protein
MQQELIARAGEIVRADERILAAWLAGSFAAGTADEYSDVNLYFYFLGNLKVVLGRGELVLLTNGSILRRDVGLIPLMLGENGPATAGDDGRVVRAL